MKFLGLTVWLWERITRADDDPYLLRLTIFKCRLFALFLHIFEGDDDLCLHDHPFSFASLILRGGYYETDVAGTKQWYGPGRLLFRRASWAHRIDRHPDKPRPITLVLASWKQRPWGFLTPSGWIEWTKYSHTEYCGE